MKQNDYRSDIDGLRAIAIIPVVLYHAGLGGFSGGFAGVDVFFVISGFLITSHVVSEIEQGRFSIVSFYERRIRRIFPALFAMVFASCLAAFFLLFPVDLLAFSKSLLAASLSVSNIYFWQALGDYFAIQADFQPFLHTWSLGVEEQFYVFLPIIVMVAAKFLSRRALLGLLAAMTIGSFALSLYGTYHSPVATFYLLPTRAWELLAGSLASFAVQSTIRHRVRSIIGLVGLLLICVAIFGLTSDTSWPGSAALLPVVGSVAIIVAGFGSQTLAGRVLSIAPARFVGKISYSWYLWHWPILVFARHYTMDPLSVGQRIVLVSISLGAAILSYLYIEQPVRRKSIAGSQRSMFSSAAAMMIVAVGVGSAFLALQGMPSRFPGFDQAKTDHENFRPDACFFHAFGGIETWNPADCQLTTAPGGRNVILWGSSYAMHYAPGFQSVSQDLGANVYLYSHEGCEPIFSFQPRKRPTCASFNAAIDQAIEKADADTVIISGLWKRQEITPEDIQDTVRHLTDRGMKVIVIAQSPQFEYTSAEAVFYRYEKARETGGPEETRIRLTMPAQYNEQFNGLSNSAGIIDPMALLCTEAGCLFARDGSSLYSDTGHLTAYGSKLSLSLMLPRLKTFLAR